MKTVISKKSTRNASLNEKIKVVDMSATKTNNVNLIKVSKSVYNSNRVKAYKPLIP